MNNIWSFDEFINESLKKVPRNSELFEKALNERGMTYADVFNRLKENGLDEEFDDVISEFGLIKSDNGDYKPGKEYYAADKGKRSSGELHIDVRVGNVQEELFLLNNPSFKRNPRAGYGNNVDFTKAPDFIFRPNGAKVEFAVSYTSVKDDTIKYTYRDSGFKYFLNEDKIIIIYFIKEDKVAVIGRHNCNRKKDQEEKDAQIKIEQMKSKETGKPIDVIIIKSDCLIDYNMFVDGDNPEIKDRVEIAVQEIPNTPKFDFSDDRYYRSVGKSDRIHNVDLDKSHSAWRAENYNKCLRKWKELIKQSKIEIPGTTKAKKEERRDWVITEFGKFVDKEGLRKYSSNWASGFADCFPFE